MSRIILTRWPEGTERVVVGWDHPCGGAFWQEFNQETDPQTGKPAWEVNENWEEVLRFDGYIKGIPLGIFRDHVPEDIRPLITEKVMDLLRAHAKDSESGRKPPVDLSE